MAGNSNQIVIKVVGDSDQFTKTITGVEGQLESVGKKGQGFGSQLGAVFGGLQLDRAAQGIISFGRDSIAAFKDAQDSQERLTDAFSRFPATNNVNIESLRKLNSELERKTKFDDDDIAKGQSVLAQYKLTGSQIQSITPLLADYAAKTGKDIPDAAETLGKALLGKGKALSEIGIKFKDAGSVEGNYAQITKGLREQVGGFAEKEGKTAAGQAQILHNQFGELQEKVGEKLLPALTKLAEIGLKIVDWFAQLNPNAQKAIEIGAGLVVAVLAINKAIQLWTAAQAALNVVLDANPIGAVILAVAALIAIGILIVKHWDDIKAAAGALWGWIKEKFDGIKDAITGAIGSVIDWLKKNWDIVLTILTGPIGLAVLVIRRHGDDIVDFFKALPGRLASVGKTIAEALTFPYRAAWNAIADLWNNSVGKISIKIPDWVPKIGGNGFDVPDLPHLASGGIVTQPTLALIGEAGPEAVVPLSRMGTSYNITVNGFVGSQSQLALMLRDELAKHDRRIGAA